MGGFCQLSQSCWKLHEMDRSSLKLFSLFSHWVREGFSASWTKVAGNCMTWIDPVLNFFLSSVTGWGGFSASWAKVAENCMKWIDPVLKMFLSSATGWGEIFCQLNQSCWKLHELDRSSLKKFSLFSHWWGGISASWTKVAGNCMKWIDPVLNFFLSLVIGRGTFLPAESKLLEIAWNG